MSASPAATRWMNASMFVITLITRRLAERPDVDDAAADRLEQVAVGGEDRLVAAGDHGDLARRRLVDAARDRALERRDAALGEQRREALELVRVVRAHVDPRPAAAQALGDPVGPGDDVAHGARRRQAGDHAVGAPRRPRAASPPRSRRRRRARRRRPVVAVVHASAGSRRRARARRGGGRGCRGRRSRRSRRVAAHGELAGQRLEMQVRPRCRDARARPPRRARRRGPARSAGSRSRPPSGSAAFSSSAWIPSQRPIPSRIRKFGVHVASWMLAAPTTGPQ